MTAFAEYLGTLIAPEERKKRRKYESAEPTETLEFGDDGELAIWVGRSKRGHKTVRWNVRRRDDDGKLLSTMRAEALPETILSLLSLVRKLSDAEGLVSDKVREQYRFICHHLDGLQSASLQPNGKAETPNTLLGDAE
ncbi:MAG: hypothetical protein AAF662_05240 [Pseudomonadota bacterium]